MWKGPIVAAAAGEDDDDGAKGESGATFFSLLKDFCGSTTAHGAPRAFEEGNGKVRSGAWMIFFLAGLGMLIYQVWGSIAEFASAGTSSTVAFARLQGQPVALPQVTVCHTSPVKCRCSAWYEDGRFYAEGACPAENAGDESCRRFYSEKLPFVCKENLRTCKTCSSVDYPFLDGTAARKAAAGFVDTEQCGTPELQAKFGFDSKTPSKLDLYQYAGYSDRSELVVECHSEGLLGGEDGSDDCSPNKYWDPVWYDHGYGACHTFNGESVTASYDDAGVCSGPACNLVQSRPGGHVHGSGMTLVLDVNVDQATPIFSADSSVHSPHLVVHVHDAKTKGLVNKGFRIYPGDETD
ncbi:Amiloride-sensitive sodium channel-domain-containing protein, partial [Baffinella frigidus]